MKKLYPNPHLVFRMTHINNLNLFLSEKEVCAPNYRIQNQSSISYQQINNKRKEDYLTSCGQQLHDFLAFYFSPITAMSYAIHQNQVDFIGCDGNKLDQNTNDIVYLAVTIATLAGLNQEILFSNRACNSFGYETSKSYDATDWSLFNESPYKATIKELEYLGVCKYFFDKDSDEKYKERKTKRMSECLIKDYLSIDDIDAIIVQDNKSYDRVLALANTFNFKGMVLLKPDCYY